MAIEPARVMLLPRFSSLVGVATFYTAPISVRSYWSMNVTAWRGSGMGSASLSVGVQLSNDMRYWLDGITPWVPSAGVEDQHTVALDREWMRLALVVGGSNPALPLWVLAEFMPRGE